MDPDAMAGAAGSIDWAAVWQVRMERHLSTPRYLAGDAFWSRPENVGRLAAVGGRQQQRADRMLASMAIPDGARVLDIGAGTGVLAVPLARRGCRVVAVEPAPAMVEAMQAYARQQGVRRIRVVEKRWEDVDPAELGEPFDAVIASHSLSMPDIRSALAKMDRVSRGSVFLFWFLTPPAWSQVMEDLWPAVHGAPFHPAPTAEVLLLALLQAGIPAGLEPQPCGGERTYATLGEAVDDFAGRMDCADPRQLGILRRYLRSRLTASGHGFSLRQASWCAKVWWRKG